VKARLAVLRKYPWNSYHAYAGYAPRPDWLTCDRLWWHAGQEKGADPKAGYRRHIEEYLRQGAGEGVLWRLTAALAIGGSAFVERLRRKILKRARGGDERALLAQAAAVRRGGQGGRIERWDDFIGRRGDYGRDLALHIGRLKCGLTLRELGKEAGDMSVPVVAKDKAERERRLQGQ
jgi:hypothetical protein